MQSQSKSQRKSTTNKLTLKIDVQGKRVPITGTPAQMASFVNKLNNGNSQKQSTINNENLPAPEELAAFVEDQENFKHSMPILMNHFDSSKESYHQMYRMAKASREYLEKRFNGKFREDRIPPADGKRKAIRTITVWVFEPKTSTT